MSNEILLLASFILDLIFGDPPLLFPHPIALIGKLIEKTESIFYEDNKLNGIIFVIFNVIVVYVFIEVLLKIFSLLNVYINFLLSAILLSFTISLKSLHFETLKVYNALKNNNLNLARQELSLLVSRDTNELEEKDIIRSVIETISENFTDGIVAPIFYFAIGGLKLAFIYKVINTLDSMIGYKNEKYINFGYFTAKLDDILNFIPARIAGFLTVISAFLLRYDYKNSFRIMLSDKNNTDSPNSGWTESAYAGALKIQLGGPTPYFGVWYDKPFIGDEIEILSLKHIKKSYYLLYLSSILFLILTLTFLTAIKF